jgi:hypothetical protein
MPPEPLDERYLTWLYGQVANVKARARSRTFWSLLRQMYKKEFVWLVPNDDNRISDGRDLRYEFLAEHQDEQGDPEWIGLPCSMLELFIVLARAVAFEMDDDMRIWFWHFIEVVDLERYNDRDYNKDAEEAIDETLDRIIWRNYSPSGKGGLFPLRDPKQDQRKVELWYQLNAYLLEQF